MKLTKVFYAVLLTLPMYVMAGIPDTPVSVSVEAKNLIFISGQRTGAVEVPDEDGTAIRQAFNQIRDIVTTKGAKMDDIVQLTIYLADPATDYPKIRFIVKEYFSDPQNKARSIVAVSRIPDGTEENNFSLNRRVEIDAVLAVK